MKPSRIQVFGGIILLFHVVGYFGLTSSTFISLFKKLVPFHILLMFGLILISHEHKNKEFWKFIVTTYIAGFIIELLGVNTGVIFGYYSYGSTLGFKIADIPLIIGVNWVLMIYSAGIFVREFTIKNRVLRAVVGAVLLTVVDFLIEPVAVNYDYWSWNDFAIPIQNSVGWFLFSFLMLLMFYNLPFKKVSPIGSILFIVQAVFFLMLNISLR